MSSGYSLFTNCSFDAAKNKLDYFRGRDCMEKFFKDLRVYAMRIVNYIYIKKKRNDSANWWRK